MHHFPNEADSNASNRNQTHPIIATDADDPTEEIATVESAVKSPAEVESTLEKGA